MEAKGLWGGDGGFDKCTNLICFQTVATSKRHNSSWTVDHLIG